MLICAAPITRGELKGQPATGTSAGYQRHIKAGQAACPRCATARSAYRAQWHQEHREEALERMRQWGTSNPDRRREHRKRWKERNPEARAESQRRWLSNNREKKADYQRRWNDANRENVREWVRRRRYRIASRSVEFSASQLIDKIAYWGNRCWLCGDPYEAVDHVVPIARGGWHCLANLRPICKACNCEKHAKDWRGYVLAVERDRQV